MEDVLNEYLKETRKILEERGDARYNTIMKAAAENIKYGGKNTNAITKINNIRSALKLNILSEDELRAQIAPVSAAAAAAAPSPAATATAAPAAAAAAPTPAVATASTTVGAATIPATTDFQLQIGDTVECERFSGTIKGFEDSTGRVILDHIGGGTTWIPKEKCRKIQPEYPAAPAAAAAVPSPAATSSTISPTATAAPAAAAAAPTPAATSSTISPTATAAPAAAAAVPSPAATSSTISPTATAAPAAAAAAPTPAVATASTTVGATTIPATTDFQLQIGDTVECERFSGTIKGFEDSTGRVILDHIGGGTTWIPKEKCRKIQPEYPAAPAAAAAVPSPAATSSTISPTATAAPATVGAAANLPPRDVELAATASLLTAIIGAAAAAAPAPSLTPTAAASAAAAAALSPAPAAAASAATHAAATAAPTFLMPVHIINVLNDNINNLIEKTREAILREAALFDTRYFNKTLLPLLKNAKDLLNIGPHHIPNYTLIIESINTVRNKIREKTNNNNYFGRDPTNFDYNRFNSIADNTGTYINSSITPVMKSSLNGMLSTIRTIYNKSKIDAKFLLDVLRVSIRLPKINDIPTAAAPASAAAVPAPSPAPTATVAAPAATVPAPTPAPTATVAAAASAASTPAAATPAAAASAAATPAPAPVATVAAPAATVAAPAATVPAPAPAPTAATPAPAPVATVAAPTTATPPTSPPRSPIAPPAGPTFLSTLTGHLGRAGAGIAEAIAPLPRAAAAAAVSAKSQPAFEDYSGTLLNAGPHRDTDPQIPTYKYVGTSFFQPNGERLAACQDRTIPTAHCAEAHIARDISATEAWINQGSSADPGYDLYAKRWSEWAGAPPSGTDKKSKERAIKQDYRSRKVKVEGVSGEFTIANPYLAHGVRERWAAGGDALNPIIQENLRFIGAVAPETIIEDRQMVMALLESMWHCGGQASLSDDPRCLPMRLLGEVREQEKVRKQEESKAEVAAMIKASLTGRGVERILSTLARPAAAAAASPPSLPIAIPSPPPSPSAAAVPTDPTIPAPPRQIGGGRLRPLLPLIALGRN